MTIKQQILSDVQQFFSPIADEMPIDFELMTYWVVEVMLEFDLDASRAYDLILNLIKI